MQNEDMIRTAENTEIARRIFSKLTVSCGPERKMSIRFALRRRPSCLTKRTMIAALREAEFTNWQDTGGDYLRSAH